MRNVIFGGVAALTLLATAAQAAPASIRVADIDLNSATGLSIFNQRTQRAARALCGEATGGAHLRDIACEAAVRAEAADKLAPAQQAQLARGKVFAAR